MTHLLCVLLVGNSFSGKTHYILHQLNHVFPKGPVHVLNGSAELLDLPRVTAVEAFEDLETVQNSALVIDDLIMPTRTQLRFLKKAVNVQGHHKNLTPIFLAVHSLLNNDITQILSFCTHVVFTASRNNLPSLKACFRHLGYPKKQQEDFQKIFLRNREPFCYFSLDVRQGTFDPQSLTPVPSSISSPSSPPAKRRTLPRDRVRAILERGRHMLQDQERLDRLLLLLDLVLQVLPLKPLDPKTLTLFFTLHTCHETPQKTHVKVNLIDYLLCVLSQKKPDPSLKALHRWMTKRLSFPRHFIENPYLRS